MTPDFPTTIPAGLIRIGFQSSIDEALGSTVDPVERHAGAVRLDKLRGLPLGDRKGMPIKDSHYRGLVDDHLITFLNNRGAAMPDRAPGGIRPPVRETQKGDPHGEKKTPSLKEQRGRTNPGYPFSFKQSQTGYAHNHQT